MLSFGQAIGGNMSVLIKGMEMPKEDCFSVIYVYGDGKVKMPVWGKGMQFVDGVTAISVPGHGRLGDLDELARIFREDAADDWNKHAIPLNWSDAFEDVACMIDDAPTIIPAEE